MKRKATAHMFLFIGILVVFCVTYYHEMLYFMPQGIHSWAQADRLSLAINFYDRGLNFFLPATHNLRSVDGIVGVEFPIQSYLAAALGKISGRDQISTMFRLLNVLISCLGLFFLFITCYKVTRNFIVSIVSPLFIFCSPVFIYYTCNYLPDSASASVIFVSFFFVIAYQDKARARDMVAAMALLTLGALIKTSGIIYLGAFITYVAIQKIIRRGFSRRHHLVFVCAALASVSVLIGYYLYNRHLNEKYDSWIFLSQAMPFAGWDEVERFIGHSFKYEWMQEYMVLPQYLLLAIITVPAFPLLLATIEGKKRLLYLFISITGALAVTYLMGMQLFEHDYYIIVILLPLIAYWLLISAIAIYKSVLLPQGQRLLGLAMLTASVVIFFFADHHVHQRLKPNYRHFGSGIPWAVNGDKLLMRMGVAPGDSILVLNEYSPNLELVYFDRRGVNIAPGHWANMGEVRAIMNGQRVKIGVCSEELGHRLNQDSLFHQHFSMLALTDGKAVFREKD